MKEILKKIGIKDDGFELLTVNNLIEKKIIDKPLDGNHGEIHPKSEDYVVEGVPFIMASDIRNGTIDYTNCNFITRNQADSLRKGFAKNGDVLVTHKATIGRTAIVNYAQQPYIMLTPQVTYYRILNTKRLNNIYLKYYFDSELFQKTLHLWAGSGSTRAYLGITEQGKLPVIIPPIKKQEKIAAILSAFDERIENNKQRITLLGKISEEIYKEWFVRLRFPNYKDVKIDKGVPEGWSKIPIEVLCNEIRSGIKKADLDVSERYIGLEHLPRKSITIDNYSTADSINSDKLLFKERDILFCKIRPYLHKVSLTHFSGSCSTDAIVIRPTDRKYEGFLLFTLFSEYFIELATIASKGTKMPRADWDFLKKQELNIPSDDLLNDFQKKFEVIFAQIIYLNKSNELMNLTKEKLLDRLISGKLSVEDIDIQFPPSMLEEEEVA